jgi:hypothetical protein
MNAYRMFVRIPLVNGHSEDQGGCGKTALRWVLGKYVVNL